MDLLTEKQNRSLKYKGIVFGIGIVLSGFFVFFGIHELIAAYSMTNPFAFLMFFFSSCLIILINTTIFLVLIVKSYTMFHSQNRTEEN